MYTAAVLLVFLYLLCTEAADRWSGLFTLWSDLHGRQEMGPENLAARRMELKTREQELVLALTRRSGSYEQIQTGVIEYLNASALSTGIKFETLIPNESGSSGRLRDVGFKVGVRDDFHRIGKFINTIETGPMSARIQKIDLQRQAGSFILATIEGTVTLIPR